MSTPSFCTGASWGLRVGSKRALPKVIRLISKPGIKATHSCSQLNILYIAASLTGEGLSAKPSGKLWAEGSWPVPACLVWCTAPVGTFLGIWQTWGVQSAWTSKFSRRLRNSIPTKKVHIRWGLMSWQKSKIGTQWLKTQTHHGSEEDEEDA